MTSQTINLSLEDLILSSGMLPMETKSELLKKIANLPPEKTANLRSALEREYEAFESLCESANSAYRRFAESLMNNPDLTAAASAAP